ncbi:methyl-accepting chemotaxis protein [Acinetobacter sp. HY1485]|uniref:methyl-accepting chemotaxis protein n=1 Tax=Acinetobacter sp. HY1485 TaxID=2970918 RepID=UPI0022B9A2C8|nr:methyl-accepting chemotaxis protein [Acinetobacter sp. HY1485]
MGFKVFDKKDTGQNHSSKNGFMKKINKMMANLSQSFGSAEQAKPYIFTGIISAFIAFVLLLTLFYTVPRNKNIAVSLDTLKLLSQTTSRHANSATASGSDDAIKKLKEDQVNFVKNFENVRRLKLARHKEEFIAIQKEWSDISENIDTITANEKILTKLYATNVAISQVIPGMQAQYNEMVDKMERKHAPTSQIIVAKNQVVLAERILRSIDSILSASKVVEDSANDFKEDTETFSSYLNAQLDGSTDLGVDRITDPELRAQLVEMKAEYDRVIKSGAAVVFDNSAKVAAIQKASAQIFTQSDKLLNELNRVVITSYTVIVPAFILILAFIIFLLCAYKILSLRNDIDQQRMQNLQEEYDRNQGAILRLLDEIADLADGDLRSYATVSEDFTGAIADSINFAIDQLRDLVSRINQTSQEVALYSQNTQMITNQLAEATEHQAQEIAGASTAMNEMALSIDEVSTNARESSEVAQRSVGIAANGAEVVNRSMQGMDTIREQIQETSKRIKRLGESSQEIGNIVSLINDIADQTNILALNAAIQASMAGEAGRGFAVVADEVQRLAERSASATKQIENLVKTIQADTNEAVISMEHTTSEVVRGANLAKDAGVALDEIQTVSQSLAQLMENISGAAQLQSASAGHIANTMNVVQDITSQTTSATFDTARSVSELANMAESLRESVTDFKLPE